MTTGNPLAAETGGDWGESRGWHAGWRAVYDRIAVRMLRQNAATTIQLLGALGTAASRLRLQGPRASAVRTLLPWMNHEDASAVARASTALLFRNRAAVALVARQGLSSLSSLVSEGCATPPPCLAAGHEGVILCGFHVGAHFGLGAALHRWGVVAFSVRETSLLDTDTRARALKHAIDVLRSGGVVLTIADGPRGSSTPSVTCLNRRVRFRRGPFMLARVTGAPVMPAVTRWTRNGALDIEICAPLVSGDADVERGLAESAARWLDDYVRRRPEELWPYTLANFLGTPLAVEQHVDAKGLVVEQAR